MGRAFQSVSGCMHIAVAHAPRVARHLTVAGLLVACASAVPFVLAKEQKPTRIVAGAVLDEADNPIAGAAVLLTDLETGEQSAAYTKEDGLYQFTGLQPTRTYEVQAKYRGQSSRVRKVTPIDPRNRVVLNLKIPPEAE